MRIVCQKCSAAYAIDDKFVTAKGVRAQCPRCRHLQLVKKDEPSATLPPTAREPLPPPPEPFAFDVLPPPPPPPSARTERYFGPPPGSPAPPAPPPAGFGFDFGPPPPPARSAEPAAPAGGFDFSALSPPPPPPTTSGAFDFDGLQPRPAPAGSAASAMLEFNDPPPPPARSPAPSYPKAPKQAPPTDSPFDFSARPPNDFSDEITVKGLKCKSCGKVMTDAFDQALGTCDECRTKEANESMPAFATPDTGAGRIEHVDTAAIRRSSKELPQLGAPPPPPAPLAPAAAPPKPVFPEFKPVKTALRGDDEDGSSGGRGRQIAIAAVVVVVLGVGGFLVARKPWARRAPPPLVKQGGVEKSKQVDAIIQQWRLNYPELEGEAAKGAKAYVDQGEALLLKDTTTAYLDAEEAFQKALVLDASSDRAVAGWVLAIAFGRGAQLDEQTAKSAEAMLLNAEQRTGDTRVYVAHAHLEIARGGNANDIKINAERGKNSRSPSDKALAELALGQTFLTKNPAQADASFREALTLDPKLKRSYFFQAQLAASQGRYKDAIEALEKRLELDKDQWEAAEQLARLYVDVGEPQRAKKVLENATAAAPTAGRPRLALAVLGYQHLGESAAAAEQLTALVNDKDVPRPDRAEAWVHLGIVARLGGDLQKASEAVDSALELSPGSVPARLQKFLVLLDKGVTSSARLELDALKGKLSDPQLEGALEGRLQLAEGKLEDAVKTLSAVFAKDPRRVDALLLAGAASAKSRADGKAWEFCLKKGLTADPLVHPVPSMTALFVRPADLLRPAFGAYEALSPKSEEDPNPSLCEGLVAWYAEDLSAADRHFSRVNSIDPRNAEAYAFRAMIALQRRDLAGATKLAGRGLDSSKTNADVYLAQALTQMAANRPDAAKAAAANAQKYNPALYSAKSVLGEAAARLKDADQARALLTSVLLYDPLYRDAKRVLYKQQL